jgi:hypothetical protein
MLNSHHDNVSLFIAFVDSRYGHIHFRALQNDISPAVWMLRIRHMINFRGSRFANLNPIACTHKESSCNNECSASWLSDDCQSCFAASQVMMMSIAMLVYKFPSSYRSFRVDMFKLKSTFQKFCWVGSCSAQQHILFHFTKE